MYFRAICSVRTGQSVNCHIAIKAKLYLLNVCDSNCLGRCIVLCANMTSTQYSEHRSIVKSMSLLSTNADLGYPTISGC